VLKHSEHGESLISSIYNILLLESRLTSLHPEFFTERADLEAMYNLCLILYILLHKFVINVNVTKHLPVHMYLQMELYVP